MQSSEVIFESGPEEVQRGEISRVNAVAQPRRRGSPIRYFGVTLELARKLPEVMKPDQRVRATIHGVREENALVVPLVPHREGLVPGVGPGLTPDRSGARFRIRVPETDIRRKTSSAGDGDEDLLDPIWKIKSFLGSGLWRPLSAGTDFDLLLR
ncbi:MAG: hypothetical protein R3234_11740 [Thermoanaerobaculia bacterium]|nr:hypothetical protein [Thermoanaerobaculia bacterium]